MWPEDCSETAGVTLPVCVHTRAQVWTCPRLCPLFRDSIWCTCAGREVGRDSARPLEASAGPAGTVWELLGTRVGLSLLFPTTPRGPRNVRAVPVSPCSQRFQSVWRVRVQVLPMTLQSLPKPSWSWCLCRLARCWSLKDHQIPQALRKGLRPEAPQEYTP